MKKILVTTDFSTAANTAVNFAVQSAKVISVEVILLHAFELSGNLYTDYMGVNKEFNQDRLNEQHAMLDQKVKEIEKKDGVVITPYFFRGVFSDSIMQVKEEHDISMIIMGTRGHGILGEKLWGNKTTALIGKSDIPVLVIPADYAWKKPQKILFSTNHFEKEPATLDFIFELANLYMAQMFVTVFTDEDDDMAETFLEYKRKLPEYEKMLKAKYNEETLVAANLFGNEFEETMGDYLEDQAIDMLIMITYQRNFWDRLFHPSRTKIMSYHTHIPLLAIPAK